MELDTVILNLWRKVGFVLLADSALVVILRIRILSNILLSHHVDSLGCDLAYPYLCLVSLMMGYSRCAWLT